ncbi:pre-mRNA-splicing factor CWC22 homolog isoform X1 [Sipha flava]|uniref:Pre-mRNA-splicing factor CWC22 homolog isoform X1 n=1 Tax=Sipha flava TaxID=143950 RepID=A0A8B8G5C3_9HEMI|nr:pre-mRNA-splicing factor CWC22 homolog isoform X1 [Sipha flava]
MSDIESKMKCNYDNLLLSNMKHKSIEEGLMDKSSDVYQRIAWYKLKTTIYVLINKVNAVNIGTVRKELLKLNILRGKGIFCQFITQAQIASIKDTHVYATLVAVINYVFPIIGELLLTKCIMQFKIAYDNKNSQCLASVIFIAHLINHSVADEMLAIELLTLLDESSTEITIEIAIVILEICGKKLNEIYGKKMNGVFDKLNYILYNENIDERIQNRIKLILQLKNNGFKVKQIDLVPAADYQITHYLTLEATTDPKNIIDYYHYDSEYELHEKEYKLAVKKTEESESEDDCDYKFDFNSHENYLSKKKEITFVQEVKPEKKTNTSIICLSKTIGYNECAQMMKNDQEIEMRLIFFYCCHEQIFKEDFILKPQLFCQTNKGLSQIITQSQRYLTCQNIDTNKLQNCLKMFAQLLFSGSMSWKMLLVMHENEDETTSSFRSYIKSLFLKLGEHNLRYDNSNLSIQDSNK